jgi:hypothetical protein
MLASTNVPLEPFVRDGRAEVVDRTSSVESSAERGARTGRRPTPEERGVLSRAGAARWLSSPGGSCRGQLRLALPVAQSTTRTAAAVSEKSDSSVLAAALRWVA